MKKEEIEGKEKVRRASALIYDLMEQNDIDPITALNGALAFVITLSNTLGVEKERFEYILTEMINFYKKGGTYGSPPNK